LIALGQGLVSMRNKNKNEMTRKKKLVDRDAVDLGISSNSINKDIETEISTAVIEITREYFFIFFIMFTLTPFRNRFYIIIS